LGSREIAARRQSDHLDEKKEIKKSLQHLKRIGGTQRSSTPKGTPAKIKEEDWRCCLKEGGNQVMKGLIFGSSALEGRPQGFAF